MTFRSVLLPAPFGPTTATMSPSSIPNVTPSTAGRPPKRFVTSSTSRSTPPLRLRSIRRQRLRPEQHPRPEGGRGGVQPRLRRRAPRQDGELGPRPHHLAPRGPPEWPSVPGDVERVGVDVRGDPLPVGSHVLDRLRHDLDVRVAGERVVLEELVLREHPQVALRESLVRPARRGHALEVERAAVRRRPGAPRSERVRPPRTYDRCLDAELSCLSK